MARGASGAGDLTAPNRVLAATNFGSLSEAAGGALRVAVAAGTGSGSAELLATLANAKCPVVADRSAPRAATATPGAPASEPDVTPSAATTSIVATRLCDGDRSSPSGSASLSPENISA